MKLNKSWTIITEGNEFRQSLASHAEVLGEGTGGGGGEKVVGEDRVTSQENVCVGYYFRFLGQNIKTKKELKFFPDWSCNIICGGGLAQFSREFYPLLVISEELQSM